MANSENEISIEEKFENYYKAYEEREALKELFKRHEDNKGFGKEMPNLRRVIRDRVIFFDYFYNNSDLESDEELVMFFGIPREKKYQDFHYIYEKRGQDGRYKKIIEDNRKYCEKARAAYIRGKKKTDKKSTDGLYEVLCGREGSSNAFDGLEAEKEASSHIWLWTHSRTLFKERWNSLLVDLGSSIKKEIEDELRSYLANLLEKEAELISDIVLENTLLGVTWDDYKGLKSYDVWIAEIVQNKYATLDELLKELKQVDENKKNEVTSDLIKDMIRSYLKKMLAARESWTSNHKLYHKGACEKWSKGDIIREIVENKYIEEIKFSQYKVHLENKDLPTVRDEAKIELFNDLIGKLKDSI